MVQIRAMWLVMVAGLVSTLASFLGGYFMYKEGLVVLEKTVEEVGRADAQAMNREAKRIFQVTDDYQKKYRDVLTRFNNFQTRDEFAEWLIQHALADLVNGNILESIVMRGIHKTDPSLNYVEYLWIDPLSTGEFEYIYSKLHPEIDNALCPAPCLIAHSMHNKTGKRIENVYNYSNVDFPQAYLDTITANNLQPGDSWWNSPILWYSKDYTPYVYIEHPMLMPPIESGFFKDMIIFVGTDLATYPFEQFMLEYNTDASMILTLLNDGLDSFILSANFPEGRVDASCKYDELVVNSGFQPCIKTLRNLTSSQLDTVTSLMNDTDWQFNRHGNYWTIKSEVFTPTKFDKLAAVHLMWFRSVSQVESEMDRALYLFIGFLVGVIIFDFLIGVAEILNIAQPLMKLSLCTIPLRCMELEEAQAMVEYGKNDLLQIYEIEELRCGIAFSIDNLREYKSFLPNTLFDQTEDESCGGGSGNSSSSRKTGTVVGGGAKTTKDIFSLGLSPSRLTAVLIGIKFPGNSDSSVPSGVIFQALESAAKYSKGKLHGFSAILHDTFLITWNTAHRDEMALRFCIELNSAPFECARAVSSSTKWVSGNAGTNTYRGFCMEGAPTTNLLRSFSFANYAMSLGEFVTIMSGESSRMMSSVCATVPVGYVLHEGKKYYQHEVTNLVAGECVEWMYAMNTDEATAPFIDMLCDEKITLNAINPTTNLSKVLFAAAEKAHDPLSAYAIEYLPMKFTASRI